VQTRDYALKLIEGRKRLGAQRAHFYLLLYSTRWNHLLFQVSRFREWFAEAAGLSVPPPAPNQCKLTP
jgi:hypothetical protein